MKKTITILSAFLLSLPLCVMAQEELFPTGTTWKEVREEIYVPEDSDYYTPMDTLLNVWTYEIGRDTIIGQRTYKQVFMNGALWDCVIREEAGCVWMLAEGYAQEFKLYDFNWDGCDTIVTQYLREQDRYATWVALENDTVNLRSIEYVYYYHRTVIRGIGCVSDLSRISCLLGHRMWYIVPPGLIFRKVLWLRRNGKEVYRYYGKNEWTTGIEEHRADRIRQDASIYDLLGRRISVSSTSSLRPKGVYIQGGRKYVK